jgi:hypothetical protein
MEPRKQLWKVQKYPSSIIQTIKTPLQTHDYLPSGFQQKIANFFGNVALLKKKTWKRGSNSLKEQKIYKNALHVQISKKKDEQVRMFPFFLQFTLIYNSSFKKKSSSRAT